MDDNKNNRVTVKIYGQEYTISGEKPRDHIIKVADHVDDVMKEIAYSIADIPTTKLSILASVNITDELFSLRDGYSELATEKVQLEKDKDHYVQLWEEAKKSFLQYKDDALAANDQKEILQEKLNTQSREMDSYRSTSKQKDEKVTALEQKVDSLTQRLKATEEGNSSSTEAIKEWEEKYKEIEGNYFELQMENIQLKGDIERYKKIVD